MKINAEHADPASAPVNGNLTTTWLAKAHVEDPDLHGVLWCSANPTPKGIVIIIASHPSQAGPLGLETATGQRVIFTSRWIIKSGKIEMLGESPGAVVMEHGEQYAGNFTEASRLRPVNEALAPTNLSILGYEAIKAVRELEEWKAFEKSLAQPVVHSI